MAKGDQYTVLIATDNGNPEKKLIEATAGGRVVDMEDAKNDPFVHFMEQSQAGTVFRRIDVLRSAIVYVEFTLGAELKRKAT